MSVMDPTTQIECNKTFAFFFCKEEGQGMLEMVYSDMFKVLNFSQIW